MTYSLLELRNLLVRQGIGLGDHRDQVDLGVQPAHDLNVQRLEGVAGGLDEVDTGVDTVVNNVRTVDLVFSLQVGIVSLLNVLYDRAPRIVVVHEITESRGVNHGQAKANAVLFNICADRLNGHGLWDDVVAGAGALLGGVERGVKKGVHKSRLSETRFT